MSAPTFALALRLRLRSVLIAAAGMVLVILMVGALFPEVGDSIGKLKLPDGVARLLGGADYATILGWMQSEIGAVYGPLVIGGIAIVAAAGLTAGEEGDGILAMVLAQPIARGRLLVSKAAAVGVLVGVLALGTWVGLLAGVALAGGGISAGNLLALCVHLAFFGFAVGAVALAIAALTGRRGAATGGAAAVAVLGFVINGFAPFVSWLAWTRFLSVFHYFEGHDPLANGFCLSDLLVLGGVSVVLVALAAATFARRDLRG